MSGPWHPTGHAKVSTRNPRAQAVCDRCGFNYQHNQLVWDVQWAGQKLQNLRQLVCRKCKDIPQTQLKTIIIPPDPLPILNARPENYGAEVTSFISKETGQALLTESGVALIDEIQDVPVPDPNNPAIYPPFPFSGWSP